MSNKKSNRDNLAVVLAEDESKMVIEIDLANVQKERSASGKTLVYCTTGNPPRKVGRFTLTMTLYAKE
jgi:hypothetical protein